MELLSKAGRVIKPGGALDNMLEELEWVLLESDISSDAVSAVIDALRSNLVGSRLKKGSRFVKVVEGCTEKIFAKYTPEAGYWDFDASVTSFIERGRFTSRDNVSWSKWHWQDYHCG